MLGQQLAASQSEAAKNPVLPALPANPRMAAAVAPEAPAENQTGGPENDQTGEIRPSPGGATRTKTIIAQSQEASQPAAKPVPDKSAGKMAAPIKTASAAGDRVARLANAGNPVALAILGLRALDGAGSTAVNLPDAIKYLSQAADKGQAVAQYRLGTLYERGQGVAADSVKAVHWYELAANQGNRKAMHNLAVAYAGGTSAKRNMTESARWFAKAAALGLADSQFNLAVLYERGEGVPQSLADAYKWYAIAALSGDAEAKARMGVLETQLNESDRSAANKSATSFHASPLIRSANVPPEPADLGT
jgi:localization factor PodJL